MDGRGLRCIERITRLNRALQQILKLQGLIGAMPGIARGSCMPRGPAILFPREKGAAPDRAGLCTTWWETSDSAAENSLAPVPSPHSCQGTL